MTQAIDFQPNFFVSIPITDRGIVLRAKVMQGRVRKKLWFGVPGGDCSFDKPGSLHVTLLVAFINRPEEEGMAAEAVQEVFEEIDSRYDLSCDPLGLRIHGLGHFGEKVLFAKVSEFRRGPPWLTEISSLFRQRFEALGIRCDPKGFRPHMTLAHSHNRGWLERVVYGMLYKVFAPFSLDDWEELQEFRYGTVRISGTDQFRVGYIQKNRNRIDGPRKCPQILFLCIGFLLCYFKDEIFSLFSYSLSVFIFQICLFLIFYLTGILVT